MYMECSLVLSMCCSICQRFLLLCMLTFPNFFRYSLFFIHDYWSVLSGLFVFLPRLLSFLSFNDVNKELKKLVITAMNFKSLYMVRKFGWILLSIASFCKSYLNFYKTHRIFAANQKHSWFFTCWLIICWSKAFK